MVSFHYYRLFPWALQALLLSALVWPSYFIRSLRAVEEPPSPFLGGLGPLPKSDPVALVSPYSFNTGPCPGPDFAPLPGCWQGVSAIFILGPVKAPYFTRRLYSQPTVGLSAVGCY